MPAIPPMNLSPDATPWGRWAQDTITDLVRENDRMRTDLLNLQRSFDALVSRVTQL